MLNQIQFQCLESSYKLGNHITRESWFITNDVGEPIRRTVYKAEDGSVVAIQDWGKVLTMTCMLRLCSMSSTRLRMTGCRFSVTAVYTVVITSSSLI